MIKYQCIEKFELPSYDFDGNVDEDGKGTIIGKDTWWKDDEENHLDTDVQLVNDEGIWIGITQERLATHFVGVWVSLSHTGKEDCPCNECRYIRDENSWRVK